MTITNKNNVAGIDYGTSNTSVMVRVDDMNRSLLRSGDDSSDAVQTYAPSEVHMRKNGTYACGHQISEAVRVKSGSDMIRNLKTHLIDDADKELINGKDKWDVFDAYMLYVINNANKSPYMVADNSRIEEVVMSYPVDASTMYATKMKEHMEALQFTDAKGNTYRLKVAHMQEEPVAISLRYFNENSSSGKVMIVDIGGGTVDLSIVENDRGRKRVKRHIGTRQAGSYLDEQVLKSVLAKANIDENKYMTEENSAYGRALMDVRRLKESIEADGDVPLQLYFNGQIVFDDEYSVDEYYDVLEPFAEDIIEKAAELLNTDSADMIVLAGGGANCHKLAELFTRAFPGMKVVSDAVDKRTATAEGNVEWFYAPTVENILNYSYGTNCVDDSNTSYISHFFYKDEKLPIVDRSHTYRTHSDTDCVSFKFYLGKETDPRELADYDIEPYDYLANETFNYRFNRTVPKNTLLTAHYSMSVDGVLKIRVESEYGTDVERTITNME